jgi:hypothetical protein
MLFVLAAMTAALQPTAAAHEPIPDRPLGAWVADSDYPAGAIQREVSGTVGFTLDVGADGVPTRCTIIRSADEELDRMTCDIFMARAHFQPARDTRGRAVAGPFTGRLRWILPAANESPPPLAAMRMANAVRLDARGNVTCSVSMNGGTFSDRASSEECGFLSGSGAAQALRARAIPGDLILVYSLVPEGAAAVPGNEAAGAALISEGTAQLVIAPDGTVAECRPGVARTFLTQLSLRIPPPCWMQGPRPFVGAVAGQEARRAETSIRVYFRRRRGR